jgi:mannitol-specific phosphotransferase system IIBC component
MQSNNNNNTNNNDNNSSNAVATTTSNTSLTKRNSEDNDDKPAVGSEEWHRLRRENHKQVERRRRETINDGINEIARIVPGCEKNKGSILQRAAVYIRQLREAEAATVEKWTLEKLLTDQAISELNRQVEALKNENERIVLQNNYLKRELESVNNHHHLHHQSSESITKKQKFSNEE